MRCPRWMMTSSFGASPVSMRRAIVGRSPPVIAARVASTSPAAAPVETYAASLRVSSARRLPTTCCSSCMSTKLPAASRMASSTGDGISDPPSRVNVASALITRRMPSRSYTPIAAVLSSPQRSGSSVDPSRLTRPRPLVRMGPRVGPNGSLPAWHGNRSYLHRRSVPLPSRSATRSAHRTTHPATPRPRPGRLHVPECQLSLGLSFWDMSCRGPRARDRRRCLPLPPFSPASICVRSGDRRTRRSGEPDRRSSPEA